MGEHYDRLVSQLARQIAERRAPWQQPHQPGYGEMPFSPVSGTRFKGINSITLESERIERGYTDNRWYTRPQAERQGGILKPQQPGTVVQYWQFSEMRDGQKVRLEKPKSMLAVVFNSEQFDGLPPPDPHLRPMDDRNRDIRNMVTNGRAALVQDANGGPARYDPATDLIWVKKRDPADNPAQQQQEAVEMLARWTGHPMRQDRDMDHPPGTLGHAREELRTRLAALMLSHDLQIGYDPGKSEALVGPWRTLLIERPTEFFRATVTAERIVEDLLELSRDPKAVELTPEQMQAMARETSEYQKNIDAIDREEQKGEQAEQRTHPSAVSAIRDVQKIMRQAERTPGYSGDPSDPTENIGPWDRAADAMAKLSENPAAKEILAQNGITLSENGWLTGSDGVNIRSYQLNPITVSPDLPHSVLVKGTFGRPPSLLKTDVVECPGLGPEHRFMSVVLRDGQAMSEGGNVSRNYATRDEALMGAAVLMRDLIDDNRLSVVEPTSPVRIEKDHASMSQPTVDRRYLAVPFAEKDNAKRAGARWDKEQKAWFVPSSADLAPFAGWLPDKTPVMVAGSRDPVDQFLEEAKNMGLIINRDKLKTNGALTYVPVEGDKKGETRGSYTLHLDGVPAGVIINHRVEDRLDWKATDVQSLTPKARTQLRAVAAQVALEREVELAARHGVAAAEAKAVWDAALPCVQDANGDAVYHPYLHRKQMSGQGLRLAQKGQTMPYVDDNGERKEADIGGRLLAPIYKDGEFVSLQTIEADPRTGAARHKTFWPGSAVKGGYMMIGGDFKDNPWPVIICESPSTGDALHKLTGHTIVVAFTAGNIPNVARAIREANPHRSIYIGADNDHTKPDAKNAGKIKALAAAELVKGHVLLPHFGPEDRSMSDWKDLQLRNLPEAHKQIAAQLAVARARTAEQALAEARKPSRGIAAGQERFVPPPQLSHERERSVGR